MARYETPLSTSRILIPIKSDVVWNGLQLKNVSPLKVAPEKYPLSFQSILVLSKFIYPLKVSIKINGAVIKITPNMKMVINKKIYI